MRDIEIIPLVGNKKFTAGGVVRVEEVETAFDKVMEGRYRLGLILRKPGAKVIYDQPVAPSIHKEVMRLLAERDKKLFGEEITEREFAVTIKPEGGNDESDYDA